MTARRTSDKPVRIYKYGCVVPSLADREAIDQELARSNDYYNALIEIERRRRAAHMAIKRAALPELEGVMVRLDAIESELDLAYEAKRGGDELAEARIGKLKDERARLWTKQRELLVSFDEMVSKAVAAYEARTSGAPDALNAQIEELRMQIIEAKKIARNPAMKDLKRSLGDLKKERRKFGERTHKRSAVNARVLGEMLDEPEWPEAWKQIAKANAAAVAETKVARAAKRCSSGTSLLVEKAVESARRARELPSFARFEGEGRVGGQAPVACDAQKIIGGKCGLIRMTAPGRRCNRRAREVRAWLDLGEVEGKRRKVEMSLSWHRDLPGDARITWVWLLVRKLGHEVRYELQFSLEAEDLPKRDWRATEGAADVRLGWAVLRDDNGEVTGLRVGSFDGEDGLTGECVLPGKVVDRLNHREANLRRFSDKHFNEARRLFARTVERWVVREPGRVPKWLTERPEPKHGRELRSYMETMWLWRRHTPLMRIAQRWAGELFSRDSLKGMWETWREDCDTRRADYFARPVVLARWLRARGIAEPEKHLVIYIEWWRRKEEHLVWWGARQIGRARRDRAQRYRDWAISLAKVYKRIRIHDVSLNETARDKGARDKAPNPHESRLRSQQRDAAPSELRHALMEVFGPDAELVKPKKRERSGGDDAPGGARNSESPGDHGGSVSGDGGDNVATDLKAAE